MEFCNKELKIWATLSSRSCFCWLYRAYPSSAAKNIINLISVLSIWVMSMCRVFACVVGRGCFLWPVHFLGKTLLVFALLHSIFQGQICLLGFPRGSASKESACNAGDLGLIPGLGRSPGEGNGNPLQYSCLENPMDWGAWWATDHRVTKSWTQLSDFTFTSHFTWTSISSLWESLSNISTQFSK